MRSEAGPMVYEEKTIVTATLDECRRLLTKQKDVVSQVGLVCGS